MKILQCKSLDLINYLILLTSLLLVLVTSSPPPSDEESTSFAPPTKPSLSRRKSAFKKLTGCYYDGVLTPLHKLMTEKGLPCIAIEDNESEAKLKRFKIEDKLGSGAYGTVVKAFDNLKKENVALKFEKFIEGERYPEFKVLPELQKMSEKANIVAAKEVLFVDDYVVLVFELYRGDLLKAVNDMSERNEKWTWEGLRKFVTQMVEVLKTLSEYGIVHADIKPENIFISESGDYYLADFGSAIQNSEYTYSVLGSPPYIPPENRHKGTVITTANDIWTMGLTFYCAVYGKNLKTSTMEDINYLLDNNQKRLIKNMRRSRPRIKFRNREERTNYRNLQKLIADMLKRNPEKRIKAEEMEKNPIFDNYKRSTRIQSITRSIKFV